MLFSGLRRLIPAAFVVMAASDVAWADASEPILILGDVKVPETTVTVSEIEAIGLHTVSLRSPHEPGLTSYSGVWLQDFIAHYGTGATASVKMVAIDFYEVEVSREEWQAVDILLATRKEGQHLEFESRGPLRVVMPNYEPNDKLHQELIPKWIWMITQIELND